MDRAWIEARVAEARERIQREREAAEVRAKQEAEAQARADRLGILAHVVQVRADALLERARRERECVRVVLPLGRPPTPIKGKAWLSHTDSARAARVAKYLASQG